MVNYEEDPRILRGKWGEGLREGMNLLHSIRGLPAVCLGGTDKDFCLLSTDSSHKLPTLVEHCRAGGGNVVSLGAHFSPVSQRSDLHMCVSLKWGS